MRSYIIRVEISFDPAKRELTLLKRGLDFLDAATVFAGLQLTQQDDRFDYQETRFQTYGLLADRLVVVVWAKTDVGRRIMSMRKCNDREQKRFGPQLG